MGRARYGVRDEIRDAVEEFYRAVSKKNIKAIDTIWAHQSYAAVAGRSGHIRQGWSHVHAYWEQRFRQLEGVMVQARLRDMSCHAVGDVAWLSGTEIRTITEGETMRQEQLRMTCVLERQGTGWHIVSYHVSEPAERLEALADAG